MDSRRDGIPSISRLTTSPQDPFGVSTILMGASLVKLIPIFCWVTREAQPVKFPGPGLPIEFGNWVPIFRIIGKLIRI